MISGYITLAGTLFTLILGILKRYWANEDDPVKQLEAKKLAIQYEIAKGNSTISNARLNDLFTRYQLLKSQGIKP